MSLDIEFQNGDYVWIKANHSKQNGILVRITGITYLPLNGIRYIIEKSDGSLWDEWKSATIEPQYLTWDKP